jgi:hypothetical protein
MPRKVFTAGEVLAAADVNEFLQDQAVMSFAGTAARGLAIGTAIQGMVTYLNDSQSLSVNNGTDWTIDRTIQVFADSTARGSAIGTAVEGMYSHLNDTDTLQYYNGSAWVNAGGGGLGILQIVSGEKSDTFTVSSTSMTNITGLSASITPSSSSSKVLVVLSIGAVDADSDRLVSGDITRGGTAIALGDAAGSRVRSTWNTAYPAGNRSQNVSMMFLDSPATTSATTYQARVRSNAGTLYVNRLWQDTDNSTFSRSISTMTLMEVAG